MGRRRQRPTTRARARLLITCDAGGSNGYRTRAWKAELAALAAETGLEITGLPLPARHPMPLLVSCELSRDGA